MEFSFNLKDFDKYSNLKEVEEYVERCHYSDDSLPWRLIYDKDFITDKILNELKEGHPIPPRPIVANVKAVVTDVKLVDSVLKVKISFTGDEEYRTRRDFLNNLSTLQPLVVANRREYVFAGFTIQDRISVH